MTTVLHFEVVAKFSDSAFGALLAKTETGLEPCLINMLVKLPKIGNFTKYPPPPPPDFETV